MCRGRQAVGVASNLQAFLQAASILWSMTRIEVAIGDHPDEHSTSTIREGFTVRPRQGGARPIQPCQGTHEVLRDIQVSERELAEGPGIPHDQVAQELREMVRARLAA